MAASLRRAVTALVVGVLLATFALAGCDTGGEQRPTDKPSGDDGFLTVAFVPKGKDISYYEAMHEGGKRAGYHRGFRWYYREPRADTPAAQIRVIETLIAQRVDVLTVAPSDPVKLAPVLRRAQRKGIRVATADTDVPESGRGVFITQVKPQAMGRALTIQLMQAMGGKGKYAIVSCERDAPKLNAWIEAQRAYANQEYPKAELVDVVHTEGDAMAATSLARDLMKEHPKLTGLVGECPSAATGVAKAVRDTDKIGEVHTVGVGAPNSMAPFLGDGSASASVIWDAERFGSLVAWAGKELGYDREFEKTNKVNRNLTDVPYYADRQMLVLGDPLVLTVENVGDYDF